ncbi:hypothetical protein M427DRAFT_212088 [Gonapodya prolifera JEL478]|uniref:Uncharacterized protein n=1 Tax=Gonapodya prolifera (strain JEL478) TaxID=1344416 RepID=A0A139APS6_GONPJ|nr:hypothetical protein M427DRAFT_212088 [Gonapodya prolifera JEL478]|eukprot:KXS18513.1 hypothetical protein M427DRAFT_212088 [Gonapodya prolifera JEL478]
MTSTNSHQSALPTKSANSPTNDWIPVSSWFPRGSKDLSASPVPAYIAAVASIANATSELSPIRPPPTQALGFLPSFWFGVTFALGGVVMHRGDTSNGASMVMAWSSLFTLLNLYPALKARQPRPLALTGIVWCNLFVYGPRTWDYHFG